MLTFEEWFSLSQTLWITQKGKVIEYNEAQCEDYFIDISLIGNVFSKIIFRYLSTSRWTRYGLVWTMDG